MEQSILVLGGSYFIGKHIVDRLLADGASVTVLNRGTRPNMQPSVKEIHCDRNDQACLWNTLSGHHFDAVIDVSGMNRQQLCNSCSVLKNVGTYIFISSSAVYDVDNRKPPFKETNPIAKNSYWTAYGTDKIEAENVLDKTYSNTETRLVVLRPPYLYGEHNYAYRESFLFDHILSGRPVILPGKGETKIQFYYAGDLAALIARILIDKQVSRGIYNVGNKEAVTFREWVGLCEAAAGKSVIRLPFDYRTQGLSERCFFPFFDYDNVLDISKIQAMGIKETPMEEGLQRSYQWYLENREFIQRKPKMLEKEEDIYQLLSQAY